MQYVHLEAVGGVAGDMFVAAMLDALPHLTERVLRSTRAILPAGTVFLEDGQSAAISGKRFGMRQSAPADQFAKPHSHHSGQHHTHRHDDEAADGKHHDHTTYVALKKRIENSSLGDDVKTIAVALLHQLAEVEAAIHSTTLDKVHFHELADWDSLVDVVAAAVIIAALPDAVWSVSDLPWGDGLVQTQHGLLPVPAPATLALLEGFGWRNDGVGGERVTPTGASILKYVVRDGALRPSGRLVAQGYGCGTRTLPGMPNILRVMLVESDAGMKDEMVSVIEFDVDDMTGEELAASAEILRDKEGVLDISVGSRIGKKGRPCSSFRILSSPEASQRIVEECFLQTSTIGLRLHEERRKVLERKASDHQGLRTKQVLRPSGIVTTKAENDDLRGENLAVRRQQKTEAEGNAG